MFCAQHSIPHEDCRHCQTTVKSMRPTVFAELAAAELRSGTEYCRCCDFIYHEVADTCPRCGTPHPFHVEPRHEAPSSSAPSVADLGSLTFRGLGDELGFSAR